ncbi:MAG: hypothetical protein ACRDBI_03390, partial [Shewanella sp.]
MMNRHLRFCYIALLLLLFWLTPLSVNADGYADLGGRRIVAVKVLFDGEQQENETYRSAVLKAFGAYPGASFEPTRSNIMLNKVKRLRFVKDAEYLPQLSSDGQVTLVLNVALTDQAKPLQQEAMGVFAGGGISDFPTLFANDEQVLLAKLENKSLIYANDRAFFGRPEVLTAGNPLATAPSGGESGPDPWLESSIEAGVYALSAFSQHISGFAGVSAIGSGSWGPELFTDQTRTHLAVEDAYLGLMANNTTSDSGVRQMNLLAGRKAFQVDNGMILRLGSANGGERAALQTNPRYAADQLFLGQFVYDNHKLELFRLDPDELEEIDSATVIHGANYEG